MNTEPMQTAIIFLKKHGLQEAKKAYSLSVNGGHEDLELLRLIKSHDLVEKMGGLDGAKGEYFEIVHSGSYGDEIHPVTLAKAIADVESCQ